MVDFTGTIQSTLYIFKNVYIFSRTLEYVHNFSISWPLDLLYPKSDSEDVGKHAIVLKSAC